MSPPIHIVKAASIKTSGGQTEGMIRQDAVVDVCDNMCSLVMLADPHTSSDIHHHGEENTIIYVVRGRGSVITEGGKTKQDLEPGDFAFIPAFTEHKEVNDGDEEAYFVIIRSGRKPITQNLDGWSK